MATGPVEQRNQDATCYVGNLDEQLTEELLWEMMLQAGPVSNVHLPRDEVTGSHQGYGFVEFRSEEDADYALKVMNMVKLFGKPLRVNKASQDRRAVEVGANLFVGGLDGEVHLRAHRRVAVRLGDLGRGQPVELADRVVDAPEPQQRHALHDDRVVAVGRARRGERLLELARVEERLRHLDFLG